MSNIILLQKDLLNELDDDELCVYLAMKHIAKQEKECFITYGHIDYILFGREGTKAEKEIVSSGLKKIIERKYIKIIDTIRGYGYVCDTSSLNVYNKIYHYTSITDSELRKIMLIDGCNRYNLLRYFIIIVGSFMADKKCESKYRFKIGCMPRSYISIIADIDIVTVNKYNKILEDNNILYISRRKYYDKQDHGVKWQTNVYSRYEDKELCEEYARSTTTLVDAETHKKQTNESRKYVQMYNAMLKGKEYDKDTVMAIYKGIKTWNEDKKKKYEEQIKQGYVPAEPKYKDLSVFKKYGLN